MEVCRSLLLQLVKVPHQLAYTTRRLSNSAQFTADQRQPTPTDTIYRHQCTQTTQAGVLMQVLWGAVARPPHQRTSLLKRGVDRWLTGVF